MADKEKPSLLAKPKISSRLGTTSSLRSSTTSLPHGTTHGATSSTSTHAPSTSHTSAGAHSSGGASSASGTASAAPSAERKSSLAARKEELSQRISFRKDTMKTEAGTKTLASATKKDPASSSISSLAKSSASSSHRSSITDSASSSISSLAKSSAGSSLRSSGTLVGGRHVVGSGELHSSIPSKRSDSFKIRRPGETSLLRHKEDPLRRSTELRRSDELRSSGESINSNKLALRMESVPDASETSPKLELTDAERMPPPSTVEGIASVAPSKPQPEYIETLAAARAAFSLPETVGELTSERRPGMSDLQYCRELEQLLVQKEREFALLESKLQKQREDFEAQMLESEAAAAAAQSHAAELDARCLDLQARLDVALADRKAKDAAMKEMEQQVAEAQEMAENLTVDKELAEEKLDSLQQEVENLKAKVEELEVDKELLQADKDALQDAMRSASPGTVPAQATAVSLELEIKGLRTQNDRLKEALQKLHELSQNEKAGLQAKLRDAEREAATVPSLLQKLEEMQSLRKKLQEAQDEIVELNETLDASRNTEQMMEKLIEKNSALEEKVAKLEEQVDDLEGLKQLDEEMQEYQKEMEKQIAGELSSKDVLLQDQARTITSLKGSLADCERTIEQFRERTRVLQIENATLREQHDERSREATELTGKSREVIQKNIALQSQALKALADAVELDLARVLAADASLQLSFWQTFVPEDVVKREQDGILAVILTSRMRSKADVALKHLEIRQQSPLRTQADSEDKPLLFLQAKKVLWAVGWRMRSLNFLLQHCNQESFQKLARLTRDMGSIDTALDSLLELIQKDSFTSAAPLNVLEERSSQMFEAVSALAPPDLTPPLWHALEQPARQVTLHIDTLEHYLRRIRSRTTRGVRGESVEEDPQRKSAIDEAIVLCSDVEHESSRVQDVCRRIVKAVMEKRVRSTTLLAELVACESDAARCCEAASHIWKLVNKEIQDTDAAHPELVQHDWPSHNKLLESLKQNIASTRPRVIRAFETVSTEESTNDVSAAASQGSLEAPLTLRARLVRQEVSEALSLRPLLEQSREESTERLKTIHAKDKDLEEAALKLARLQVRLDQLQLASDQLHDLQSDLNKLQVSETAAKAEITSLKEKLVAAEAELAKAKEAASASSKNASSPSSAFKRIGPTGDMTKDAGPSVPSAELEAAKAQISSLTSTIAHLKHRLARATESKLARDLSRLANLPLSDLPMASAQRLHDETSPTPTSRDCVAFLTAASEDLEKAHAGVMVVALTPSGQSATSAASIASNPTPGSPTTSTPITAPTAPVGPGKGRGQSLSQSRRALADLRLEQERQRQQHASAVEAARSILSAQMPGGVARSDFGSFLSPSTNRVLLNPRSVPIGRLVVPTPTRVGPAHAKSSESLVVGPTQLQQLHTMLVH